MDEAVTVIGSLTKTGHQSFTCQNIELKAVLKETSSITSAVD